MLADAQRRGFVGPAPLPAQVAHALDMCSAAAGAPARALDLGSGGGLPGLVLALEWPGTELVLLEGGTTRAGFLEGAIVRLGLGGRVSVLAERAETAGRGPLRAAMDLVVARSFGPPAVTAECAAPFLRTGGELVVAEPPGGDPSRWNAEGLDRLGLEVARSVASPSAFQVLLQARPCPDAFPRRTGIPSKRPLF